MTGTSTRLPTWPMRASVVWCCSPASSAPSRDGTCCSSTSARNARPCRRSTIWRSSRPVASGLIIAPHAFYPIASALGHRLVSHAPVFDAVELNLVCTRRIDFNRQAVAFAKAHAKPLVGNTDLHRLDQLGTTYSLVDADPDPDAICDAIRGGRVEVRTEPIGLGRAGLIMTRMVIGGLLGRVGFVGGISERPGTSGSPDQAVRRASRAPSSRPDSAAAPR